MEKEPWHMSDRRVRSRALVVVETRIVDQMTVQVPVADLHDLVNVMA